MNADQVYVVVDAGNTRLKVAFYKEGQVLETQVLDRENEANLPLLLTKYQVARSILSSVRSLEESTNLQELLPACLLLKEARIPIQLDYETPQTLGADRLANAVAIAHETTGPALAIDFGTCIKFDLVDEHRTYQGGSISPGIGLRYRSMHEFTGALPLLNETEAIALTGKSTKACMHSGVINGIQGEIDYFIDWYQENYPGLTIFVTGGDYLHFDYSRKKNIFADVNLTLKGLYLILKANAK